jgi:MoxR-like ATPase
MTTEPALSRAATDAGDAEASVARFCTDLERLRAEIGRRLVGQADIVEGVLAALLAGGHVLLEGVPGLGKTLLVKTLGEALDLSFSRVQFTPDLMPADVIGTNMIVESGGERRFEFQRGPIFAHLVLADEINRATPKTQSALLEAMQEQSVTVGKQSYPLPPPFFVLATQNPIEMEGTYPLPEAQLDRFFFKLRVDFPARDELHAILDRTTGSVDPEVRPALGRERILEMRDLVRQVPVARPVQDYAVRLVEATHPARAAGSGAGAADVTKFVRYGSSPRGAQALVLAAKIRALAAGRFTPSFDDVRRAAPPALRHRVLLNFEGEAEGISTDAVLAAIMAALPEQT